MLVSNNASHLADWYRTTLRFEMMESNDLWKVKFDDFEITIKELPNAVHRDSVLTKYQKDHISGFFKFGFETSSFDEYYELLKENESRFLGEKFYDDHLNRRSFMIKDPDGNGIKFFESRDKKLTGISPFFFSVVTPHVGESEKWYQLHFNFENIHNLDLHDDTTYVRLMENEHLIIELIEDKHQTILQHELDHHIVGIHAIDVGFQSTDYDQNKLKVEILKKNRL